MSSTPAKKQGPQGTQTILWWIGWITATICSFFIAVKIWTPWVAAHLGPVSESRNAVVWVGLVFGTWMVFLIPLIIFMYQKVDKAYEDARIRREKNQARFRSILVPEAERRISSKVSSKMQAWPETINGGHLVRARLKDGREIPYVFISERREVLGVYDARSLEFSGSEIEDVEPEVFSPAPVFLQTNWLRLDGAAAPE